MNKNNNNNDNILWLIRILILKQGRPQIFSIQFSLYCLFCSLKNGNPVGK